MDTTFIYGLSDPRTPDEVRYIGKANDPQKRLSNHVSARGRHRNHRTNWLNKLAADGVYPVIKIIDRVPVGEWQLMERYWIAMYRDAGYSLVNSTIGGEGVSGREISAEERARFSERIRGNRYGAANRGKTFTEERKRNISVGLQGNKCGIGNKSRTGQKAWNSGKTGVYSDATLAKMSRPKTDAARAKMSAAKKGKPWTAARRAALVLRQSKKQDSD